MSWEPFEWGRRKDDVKQKVIAVDQSQLQLQQVRSQILMDVNNRYRKLAQSRQGLTWQGGPRCCRRKASRGQRQVQ